MKGNFSIKKNPLYTYLFVGCLLEPGIEIWQFFDFTGDFFFKKKSYNPQPKISKIWLPSKNFAPKKKKKRKKKTCPTVGKSPQKKVTIGHQNQLSNNIL